MKVDELIIQLEKQGLEIHTEPNKEQTALYYLGKIIGNKFLELHYNKTDEVTIVKFYTDTFLPASLEGIDENSGDDDNSITRQVRAENCSVEDIITVAVASYNEVKKKYQLKHKK
ncbi:Uncharacterised protein [Streptococcus constellatus]|uniref:Uncharacterized protein n=1 Tax=Streptococcus constellatus TaxID=76860 RepID=A0A564T0E7_STRCV|nr:hypothetical protein [Streptococcus constellatus]VUW95557.1 Uncharacterised protein [Streptococcus gordonii]VUX00772.1 Uncharacterised protein [Streptococcus constellatus]